MTALVDLFAVASRFFQPEYGFALSVPRSFFPAGYVAGLAGEMPRDLVCETNEWRRGRRASAAPRLRNVYGLNFLSAPYLGLSVGGEALADFIRNGTNAGVLEPLAGGLQLGLLGMMGHTLAFCGGTILSWMVSARSSMRPESCAGPSVSVTRWRRFSALRSRTLRATCDGIHPSQDRRFRRSWVRPWWSLDSLPTWPAEHGTRSGPRAGQDGSGGGRHQPRARSGDSDDSARSGDGTRATCLLDSLLRGESRGLGA